MLTITHSYRRTHIERHAQTHTHTHRTHTYTDIDIHTFIERHTHTHSLEGPSQASGAVGNSVQYSVRCEVMNSTDEYITGAGEYQETHAYLVSLIG